MVGTDAAAVVLVVAVLSWYWRCAALRIETDTVFVLFS